VYKVELTYPVGSDWEATELAVAMAAGRPSDYSAVTCSRRGLGELEKYRQHVWNEREFRTAVDLRRKLAAVRGVTVTCREA
jgi:hypothetical protein